MLLQYVHARPVWRKRFSRKGLFLAAQVWRAGYGRSAQARSHLVGELRG